MLLASWAVLLFAGCGAVDSLLASNDGPSEIPTASASDDEDAYVIVVPDLEAADPRIIPRSLPALSITSAQYRSQAAFADSCGTRPPRTVCIRFSDGYIWLVSDDILSWSHGEDVGNEVEIAVGRVAFYYHVPDTTLVKEFAR